MQLEQQREFHELMSAGKNPYEIFRKRDFLHDYQRMKGELLGRIQKQGMEIGAQIMREEQEFYKNLHDEKVNT